jgi:transposase InsO family protein
MREMCENWRKFKAAWTNYELAAGFSAKDDKIRVALLLSVIGEEAVEAYETFTWTKPEEKEKITTVVAAFEAYCIPRANEMFETYRFGCRKQEEGESIDAYVTSLRRLADNCNFTDKDRRLRDQVVLGLREDSIRERILREKDPDIKKVLELVRAFEIAVQQSQVISEAKGSSEANYVQRGNRAKRSGVEIEKMQRPEHKSASPASQNRGNSEQKQCRFCGQNHHFGKKEECPAWGKTCNICRKKNHFSKCCRDKSKDQSNLVEQVESLELYSVGSPHKKKTKTVIVTVTREKLVFMIDTGASCNVISLKDYIRVTGDVHGNKLTPKKVQLITYGGRKWGSLGICNLQVEDRDRKFAIPAVVVDIDAQPLMCLKTLEELGIVKILSCDQEHLSAVQEKQGLTRELILKKYPDVFKGLGKLDGKYKIYTDETVQPVIHPPRKFPVPIREELKKRLAEMEEMGVIRKVTEPTDWVSSLLVVREPTKLRICLDPRDLNKAIKREHYPLPCIEEVVTRLTDVKVFSVLDATKGFWQIELEDASSHLTTFNTPFGRFRWLRMPFGISSAPEVWQRRMHEFAEDLPGTEVIADDFLVCGRGMTEEEANRDHDTNMLRLLEKARRVNLKLNPSKMKIKLDEAPFIGHVLTKDGLKVDPKKVEAVQKMTTPQNPIEMMRFLGMVQYCAKFLPRLSEVTEPLRRLTDKDAEWKWDNDHEIAFEKVKKMMTTTPVLAYYDSKKEVVIQCDASQSGIGAVLMQEGRPVHFSSRAMTQTETRYAQIEKEMLAIVHSCARFEQYIYGRCDVRVESDHKPLEVIFKKPITSSPKRLQRMLLFLQKFQLTVTYKKGKDLFIADTLSRAYLKSTVGDKLKEVLWIQEEAKVCSEVERIRLINSVNNSNKRIEEIRQGVLLDADLQQVSRFVREGWPYDRTAAPEEVRSTHVRADIPEAVRPYFLIRDELTIEDDILYKGNRIIIPKKMRLGVMQRIHQSHIGIDNSLRRAREYVYWPRMNSELKDYISKCTICNSMRQGQRKESMKSHDVPNRAWKTVSSDIFMLNGQDYVIMVDHYSDFFEYELLRKATTEGVVKFMKRNFARYGVPDKVISDNGPQYASYEFRNFAKDWEFEHITSSPLYPKANGKAESAVKVCKMMMKKARDGKADFFKSLMDWRNTATAETELSPAQRCLGRRTRTLIPTKEVLLEPSVPTGVKERKELARVKAAVTYNRGARDLQELAEGDIVRVKLPGDKKLTKGIIREKVGERSYIIRARGGEYRRNRKDLILTKEDSPTDIELADRYLDDIGTDPGHERERRQEQVEIPMGQQQIPRRSGRIRRAPDRYRPE